jgi:hypothetical protein
MYEGRNESHAQTFGKVLGHILKTELRVRWSNVEVPQQNDGSSCGVFACLFLRHFVKRLPACSAIEEFEWMKVDCSKRVLRAMRREGERGMEEAVLAEKSAALRGNKRKGRGGGRADSR